MKLVELNDTDSFPYGYRNDWMKREKSPDVRVAKTASVVDNACVMGSASVMDNACVMGSASVMDNACVGGNTSVMDNASVMGSASVMGNARVGDSAIVGGRSSVGGSALVRGNARVVGNGELQATSDYITIGPIGTRQDTITLHRDTKIGVRINAGCWSGSFDEFMARLTDEHDDYSAMIPAAHALLLKRMTPLVAQEADEPKEDR